MLWDLQDSDRNRIIGEHSNFVWSVSISRSEKFIVSGGRDCKVMLWDLQDSDRNRIIGEHSKDVWSVSISRSDKFIISGGSD